MIPNVDILSEDQQVRAAALYTVRNCMLEDSMEVDEWIELAEWVLKGSRSILSRSTEHTLPEGRSVQKVVNYAAPEGSGVELAQRPHVSEG